MPTSSSGVVTFPRNQQGLALLVALIVLVAMSLAGVALIRSVDTNTLVASNMAFRQSASLSADAGVEAARTWLMSQTTSALGSDSSSNGYYATSKDTGASIWDLTGNMTAATTDNIRWKDNTGSASTGTVDPKCLDVDTAGNRVCYLINRMCDATGSLTAASCSTINVAAGGSSQGASRQMSTYQEGSWSENTLAGYYRVTVRTAGPRNNASFIQVFLVI